jgi:hypothetical protein
MHWQSFSGVEHEGVKYGLKAESFPPFHDLPMRVSTPLEMAVGGKSVPRAELSAAGWRVVNPLDRKTPWDYQRYIQDSKAEFTLAKHGYVLAQPGWFSERSAVYLASGRPVVVQETGFSTWLPGGLGVLPFLTPDEAVDSIDRVNRDYPRHCRAARALAEEYFDSASVLTDLLDRAMQPRAVA